MGRMGGDWKKLGKAITRRRVELGMRTLAAFSVKAGLSTRLLGDLEGGKRTSYDPATLARVEQVLDWPGGHVEEILGQSEPADVVIAHESGTTTVLELKNIPPSAPDSPAPDPSWLSTPEGIARHLHRDDLPLVALLHRAGLTEADLFKLILRVRARREIQNAALLQEVAAAIRELGGWAPEQPYPPTWLVEGDGERP